MIFLSSIIATIISVIFLILSPFNGVLLTLLLKPIIDASWQNFFLGFNCLQIVGVAMPIFILPRIIGSRQKSFFDMPLSTIGTFYLISNLLAMISIILIEDSFYSVEFLFRVLNGFIGFFMFQFFFHNRDNFLKLLYCLLLAGLFPMSIGAYQVLTGKIWNLRETVGLVRNIGLYHDAFSIRAFGFQTLSAIILIWSYSPMKNFFRKIVFLVYGIICCLVIFKSYSKAGIVIFCIWIILWAIFNKKPLFLLIIPIAVLSINTASHNKILEDVQTLFSKEIGAYDGSKDKRLVLAGRTIIWKRYWKQWKEEAILNQLVGSGENPNAHNEFLRILYCNGIIGLIVFVIMYVIIGHKLLKNLLARASPLNLMGFMIYAMWIVDTIGLHPGMYPAYQWYIWGFAGLALRGVEGLDESDEVPQPVKTLVPT